MKTKLFNPKTGVHEFEAKHAEKILKMPNNGGWVPHEKTKKADEKSNSEKSNSGSGNTKESKE